MKYFELILIALFVAIICAIYFNRTEPTQTDFKRYQDSLNNEISILKTGFDSLSKIERTQINKKTIINNHYDSTKTTIYYLTDSANFDLLRSNLARYDYLNFSQTSQND